MQASPKRRAKTAASPNAKQTITKTTTIHKFTETMLDQRAYDELQLTLKERDIELEHKMNMLASVNAKLSSYTDLKNDVAQHSQNFQESEANREEL